MQIQRHETGPRMSKAVVHGDTVYLAGIVADTPKGKGMAEQVKSILSQIDGLLAGAGTDKSKLLSANIWITDMANFAEMNGVWDAGYRPAIPRREPPWRRNSPPPTMWSRSWLWRRVKLHPISEVNLGEGRWQQVSSATVWPLKSRPPLADLMEAQLR